MGRTHSLCYQATGAAKVVAVVDVEPDRREAAKSKLGCETFAAIEEMLTSTDIGLVDVCTPTYLHKSQVIAAAQAGKHVMCEKPMSLSVEDCDEMIEAARKAGVKMMVGQVLRFWPEYRAIKELVDSGKYGKVQWLNASRVGATLKTAWNNWFQDEKLSGGAVLDLQIHDQDFINYLVGPPKKIQAKGVRGDGGALDSTFALGWGHEGGVQTSVHSSLALKQGFPFNMSLTVACEKATIKFDSSADPSLMVYTDDAEPFAPELPEPMVDESSDHIGNIRALGGYFNEINYFLSCIRENRNPTIVTPETAREAVRLCLAVRKSVETGEIVEL